MRSSGQPGREDRTREARDEFRVSPALWGLATVFGVALDFGLYVRFGEALFHVFGGVTLMGAVLGLTQWLTIHRLRGSLLWVAANATGWPLAFAATQAGFFNRDLAVAVAFAAVGIPQWLVLRRYTGQAEAARWVFWNNLLIVLAIGAGFFLMLMRACFTEGQCL